MLCQWSHWAPAYHRHSIKVINPWVSRLHLEDWLRIWNLREAIHGLVIHILSWAWFPKHLVYSIFTLHVRYIVQILVIKYTWSLLIRSEDLPWIQRNAWLTCSIIPRLIIIIEVSLTRLSTLCIISWLQFFLFCILVSFLPRTNK